MSAGIDLILHPGHGKCGSSSIQADIYKQRERLEGRGVFIPDGDLRFRFEPQTLPSKRSSSEWYPLIYFQDLIVSRLDLSHLERRLDEAIGHAAGISGCERLLISAENLGNFRRGHTLEIHRRIASRFERPRILYYVRQQDDWLLSSWQQWGHKEGLSLDAWVERCLRKHEPAFLTNAEGFEDVYGEGSLAVIPFHRSAFVDGNLVADFYRRAGLELTADTEGEVIHNQAVNPYFCDILARIPSAFGSIHDLKARALLDRHVSSPELLHRRHPWYMHPSIRERILDHFARDNEELHRRYFPHLDFDELFRRPPAARDEPGNAEELEGIKEILAIQTDMLLHLLQQADGRNNRPSLAGRLKNRVTHLLRPWGR